MLEVLTPESPRWGEFVERLDGPEGCNFHELTPGDPTSLRWTCKAGSDRTKAVKIMKKMGGVDVRASLEFFSEHGGHCDCEILFNVDK